MIQELTLKNGRIGMAPFSNFYFVSLSTSEIISIYNLFDNVSLYSDSKQYININPLQYNFSALKKRFILKLLSISGDNKNIYHIEFTSRVPTSASFFGEIWIDKSTLNLIKIKLATNYTTYHPFKAIKPNHKIDSVAFSLAYTFKKNNNINKLDYINFGYSFKYTDETSTKKIDTKGIVYLFDNEKLFYAPKFNYNATNTQNKQVNSPQTPIYYGKYTDYDKIVSLPYNDYFWNHNDAILLSDKKKSHLDFFSKHGVLLNYKEINSQDKALFNTKKQIWSAVNRINLKAINGKNNFSVNLVKQDIHGFSSDLCKLKGQIFLDINQFEDTISYITSTIIDLDESFFYLQEQPYTCCFINIYYDLIEIQRLELMGELNRKTHTIAQIDSVYNLNIIKLEQTHKKYLKEVEKGENDEALIKWNKYVFDKLKIDNSILFNDSIRGIRTRSNVNNTNEITAIERYNTATAFYNIAEYEKAKELFLEAVGLNDQNPWLFYNLALTYHMLKDDDNACKYLKLSQEKGEKIDSDLMDVICKH